jgi:hypothetical protein
VEAVSDNAGSVPDAAGYLGIAWCVIATAMRYHAAYPGEIDAWMAANRDVADRERALCERQRDHLA